jgi:hypothetical protein
MQEQRQRALPLWIAAAFFSVWAVVTTPLAWSAFERVGRSLRVSDAIWQFGFVMWWFVPASVVAVVAVWRRNADRERAPGWVEEANWR